MNDFILLSIPFGKRIAEPDALVNGQNERRINAPPLTSASASAMRRQGSKSNECSRPRTAMVFLISVRIVLYRIGYLGTIGCQSGENSYYFECHNLWKSRYLQGFSQFKSFLENKIKCYFLKFAGLYTKAPLLSVFSAFSPRRFARRFFAA